jgi:hypothetical protein
VRWPPALAAVLVVAGLAAWQDERFDALGSALVMTRLSAVLLALGPCSSSTTPRLSP